MSIWCRNFSIIPASCARIHLCMPFVIDFSCCFILLIESQQCCKRKSCLAKLKSFPETYSRNEREKKRRKEINQGESKKGQKCWCQIPDHFQKIAEINRSFKFFENFFFFKSVLGQNICS